MDEGTEPAGPPAQALTEAALPEPGLPGPDGAATLEDPDGAFEYEFYDAPWWHKGIVRSVGVLIAVFVVIVVALVVYGSMTPH